MEEKPVVKVAEFAARLGLTVLLEGRGEIVLDEGEINRPGLQLAGYFEHYAHRRVHLIGNSELHFMMQLEKKELLNRLHKIAGYDPPCFIFTRGHMPDESFMQVTKAYHIPIFSSPWATAKISHAVTNYIDRLLAPVITRHGVLLDIYGVGVMLMGESGLGKSETALELVKSGHRLVADDVVEIRRVAENRLSGTAPALTRHLMEIRGIGIIDVRYMYGVGAVILEKSIDVVIVMEMWQEGKNYERLGLDEEKINIMGVDLPRILVPVRPGRNLTIVVEVAARNHRLKNLGYDAAKEFDRRWMEELGNFE